MPRHADGAASLGQEGLDDAVLERMEGHDDEPAAGLQDSFGGGERRHQLGQLLVDENPQRLERPRRRMDLVRLGTDHAADDIRQRLGGDDRRLLAGGDDGARDAARMALLAELEDDVGQIALGCLRHHVGGARPLGAHAHVERAVEPEREAALGLVELHRGHAEIEHDAVDRRRGRISRATRSSAEKRSSTSVSRPLADCTRPAPLATALWSRSMPMTCASAAARIARRIAAGAEGAVDINSAVANVQKLERRPREHGNVTGRSASDSRAIAARHHSRAPSGSSAALSKPGRFIAARTAMVAPTRRAQKRTGLQIEKV